MVRSLAGDMTVSNGNVRVVSGLEAVRQRVEEHVRFHVGEWFLNGDAGTPWRTTEDATRSILGHQSGAQLAAARFAAHLTPIVQELAGSTSTVSVGEAEINRETRRLDATMIIDTPEGTTEVRV